MKFWIVIVAALVPAIGSAQQVMAPPRPAAPLDSAARYYRGMLVALRDSVNAVSSRATEFRRDLQTAGDITVLAKAERLARACAAARPMLTRALPDVHRATDGALLVSARDSLRVAIRALDGGLVQHCVLGLAPVGPGARADTLRAWGRYRTAELQHLIVVYQSAAARFAGALGFKLPPVEAP